MTPDDRHDLEMVLMREAVGIGFMVALLVALSPGVRMRAVQAWKTLARRRTPERDRIDKEVADFRREISIAAHEGMI